MSRSRIGIVAAIVAVFVIGGGILIYANRSHGGANVTLNVTVTGAKSMTPSQWTAHQNDTLTVNVTSDTDGEVHLHGYDIHFNCKAGQVTSETFKADKTGSFDTPMPVAPAPSSPGPSGGGQPPSSPPPDGGGDTTPAPPPAYHVQAELGPVNIQASVSVNGPVPVCQPVDATVVKVSCG